MAIVWPCLLAVDAARRPAGQIVTNSYAIKASGIGCFCRFGFREVPDSLIGSMMTDDQVCLRPATELAEMIRSRELSSRELLELCLARVERINPAVNAVVTLDRDAAFAAAAQADERTARGGALGPLHGLPITIKDAIEVAGLRSTGGSTALADHRPEADAPAVDRLRSAGAVVFGKTNVPEWSGDIQTFNSLFGATRNPWDPTRTSGGSSGGPAVAVATGMSSFELGTDIGGSIRIPSSYCGVCGHKPSFGVVFQRGYLDSVGGGTIDADINVFGPIARSVGDLSLLMDVIAGPDADDAVAWRLSLPGARHESLSGYRIGLWLDDPACEVEPAAVELMATAAQALSSAGARVQAVRPSLDLNTVRTLFSQLVVRPSRSAPPASSARPSGARIGPGWSGAGNVRLSAGSGLNGSATTTSCSARSCPCCPSPTTTRGRSPTGR